MVKEEEKVQWLVYYVSKRLLNAKTMYPELEKQVLALMVASRKIKAILSRTPDQGLS